MLNWQLEDLFWSSFLIVLEAVHIRPLPFIIKALANEDTLLRTHCCRHKCFPVCPHAQHLLRTQILCPGHKKCFWFCLETVCVRNKCFPVCAAQETSWATVCPQQCVLVYQGLYTQQCCHLLRSNVGIVWPQLADTGPTMRYVVLRCCAWSFG